MTGTGKNNARGQGVGLALVAAATLWPIAAVAQTAETAADIGTIVVTAQRREQELQDVALAVTALNERMLDQMGGSELRDYAAAVPGLDMQDNRAGENRFSIRGVSEIGGGAPSVGVYIDEIPLSTFSGEGINLKTFDVSRLEVLRGPQGTLYGEGSLGGTIRVITNRPDPSGFAGRLDATASSTEAGGFNHGIDAMFNAPLGDRTAVRATLSTRDTSGWIDNPALGEDGINGEESFSGRLSLRTELTDRLILDATYIRQKVDSDGVSKGDKNSNHVGGVPEPRSDELDIFNVTATYNFEAVTLTSATSYFARDSFSTNDFTALAPFLSFLFSTPINTAYINRPNEQEVFTQEVRLVSDAAGRLDWTLGAFYKHDNLVIANSTVTDPSLPVEVFDLNVDETAEQFAVYGEIDYAITDRLHGVVGVRYFSEDREIISNVSGLLPLILSGASASDLPVSSSEERLTSRFSLYYNATDTVLLFATASSGFRAGGINPQAFLFPGAPTSFGPESLWNYELGAKTSWFDNRLIVNASVYQIEWDDVIVNAVTGDPLFAYSVNAGEAHSTGFELEVFARPVTGLELGFSAALMEAEIDSVQQIGATPPPATPGASLPFVPDYRLHASAQYTWPISGSFEARVRLDATHTGHTYSAVDNNPAGVNEAYSLVNARATLVAETWEIGVFVDNLGDERGELAFAGNGESLLVTPRTAGVTLRTRW